MKQLFNKYIISSVLLLASIFSCTEDRIINNGDTYLEVRTKINQNFSDLYDSIQHHTDLLQVIDYIGIQDTLGDHRTAVNALIAGDIALDLRIDALELIDHTHSNISILNATTASYTTVINTTIGNHTTYINNLNDSIAKHTDTLQLHNDRLKVLESGGIGGTGDVKVDGTTIPNTIAYWSGTDSTLVSNDVVKLYADSAVFTEEIHLKDSLRYDLFKGLSAGSIWFTNTSTGAIDTAHTEPAYIGWEMKDLPTLEEYEADIKMINGHMERRVWYIDYETKELKSQYGWDGLGMMNTQSAYMIYHEITVRWMFEQNRRIKMLENGLFALFIVLFIGFFSSYFITRR